jgi:hypothetical protein
MSRYFFQAHYHGATVVDDIGEEFATAQEAEAHAAVVANELGQNDPRPVTVFVLTESVASMGRSYQFSKLRVDWRSPHSCSDISRSGSLERH